MERWEGQVSRGGKGGAHVKKGAEPSVHRFKHALFKEGKRLLLERGSGRGGVEKGINIGEGR